MFITVDDANMKLPLPIAAQGEYYWSSVQMMLRAAWFLVDYAISGDETGHQRRATILVAGSKDVVAIGKMVSVVQVAIVTPAWMNHSDGWKMDSLKEMWVGSEPDAKARDTATVCLTVNGVRHVMSALHTPDDELVNLRRVF